MSLLKSATRRILQSIPMLSVPKENVEINRDDYLFIIKFRKGNMCLMVEDDRHFEEMMKDTSITKEYLSADILKGYEYLPFIQLGIEYLREHGEYEDDLKGNVILDLIIRRIYNEIEKQDSFLKNIAPI